jgi:O-acetyl-ADP-ribose deacetylase (regulator of RNase III)
MTNKSSRGTRLTFALGDLFDADTDALVISANNWLKAGSGAARAAVDRGGPEVLAALQAHRTRAAPLPRAAIVTLPGGRLQDPLGRRRQLIHVVTTWYDRQADGSLTLVPATPQHVCDATTAAIREAARLGARSVALMPMCARPGYSTLSDTDARRVMTRTTFQAAQEAASTLDGRLERIELVLPDLAALALLQPDSL